MRLEGLSSKNEMKRVGYDKWGYDKDKEDIREIE